MKVLSLRITEKREEEEIEPDEERNLKTHRKQCTPEIPGTSCQQKNEVKTSRVSGQDQRQRHTSNVRSGGTSLARRQENLKIRSLRPAVRKTRWNAPTESAVVPKVPKKKVSWDKTSAVKKAKNHRIVQKFRAEPDEFKSLLSFINERMQLVDVVFKIVSRKDRNSIFPELKDMSDTERKEILCKFIKLMSRKRLIALIEGRDLAESSSTESSESDVDAEESTSQNLQSIENEKDDVVKHSGIKGNKTKRRKQKPLEELEDGEIVETSESDEDNETTFLADEGQSLQDINIGNHENQTLSINADSCHKYKKREISQHEGICTNVDNAEHSSQKSEVYVNIRHQQVICTLPFDDSDEEDEENLDGEQDNSDTETKLEAQNFLKIEHSNNVLLHHVDEDTENSQLNPRSSEDLEIKSETNDTEPIPAFFTSRSNEVQTVPADSTTNFGDELEFGDDFELLE